MKYIFSLVFSAFYLVSCQAQDLDKVQGLKVGEKAPLLVLEDAEGEKVNLKTALEDGPIVLVFYRGQWCPYCNKHLAELNGIADSLNDLGVQLYAISPDKPELLNEMQEKTEAKFTLLHDSAYQTILAFDLAFQPSSATRLKYKTILGADLSEDHGDERELLPVPATFLIDEKGIIRWRHFDPDYKNRSNPSEVLKAAQKLP